MKLTAQTLFIALLAATLTPVACQAAIVMEFVDVGDINNPEDPEDGDIGTGGVQHFGTVDHAYAIGRYEVTITEYTAFLNAVAATDTFNLYNTLMQTNAQVAGITRAGTAGSFTYTATGNGSRPITYVSWFDAARFANWMHNGQPTGPQNASTTETGAYTLNGAVSGITVSKNDTANIWIPSENEWYKAAYYQPASAGGDTDSYWKYPTRSNTVPNSRNGSTTDANSANFFRDDAIVNGFNGGYAVTNSPTLTTTNYLTPGGAFTLASTYYGAFDMGGNVQEWNDGIVPNSFRSQRGGAWNGTEQFMRADDREYNVPTGEDPFVGFRLAIPEPATPLLAMIGAGLFVSSRKRKPRG